MPIQSVANNLELSSVPPELSCLNRLETRLLCLRVAFMTLVALPAGKQRCIHGPAVNIPVQIDRIITTLPRLPDDSQLVPLKFKRKLSYKGHYMYDFITPEKILDALRWLKLHHPQYANVAINDKWSKESEKQDFDLHAGLIKSFVHIEPSVVDTISVGSSPVVVKQPLMSDSPTTGIGNDIHNSLGDAVTHLRGCATRANLMILDVPGDGNCLYWSKLYQLKANGACASSTSISKLRLITAAYLESHSDFYSHFLGESILSSNPMNADTEAPDDDDAQVSQIPDPHERSQARWLKYTNRIRHGAWGDNLCIAALANVFSVTVMCILLLKLAVL